VHLPAQVQVLGHLWKVAKRLEVASSCNDAEGSQPNARGCLEAEIERIYCESGMLWRKLRTERGHWCHRGEIQC
jgi:hypothetical protein